MTTQIYCIGEHPAESVSISRSEQREPLTAKFDRLMADLETRNTDLEHFVRTVTHDLKSPLITIKGFLALLRRDAVTGDRELLSDDIRQIGRAADRLLQLLDELWEYHRIGQCANLPEEVPLGALARQALDLALRQIDGRGLEVVIAPDLPSVTGDASRLLQVFQQLFGNALRFMGNQESPRIEVSVREGEGEAICCVRDNGAGIEPRDHQRIFKMFKRLETGKGGTGAGLALVKRIVEVHDGRVWVESEGRGTGSTFCFTLP